MFILYVYLWLLFIAGAAFLAVAIVGAMIRALLTRSVPRLGRWTSVHLASAVVVAACSLCYGLWLLATAAEIRSWAEPSLIFAALLLVAAIIGAVGSRTVGLPAPDPATMRPSPDAPPAP